jgi:hypothetical protein
MVERYSSSSPAMFFHRYAAIFVLCCLNISIAIFLRTLKTSGPLALRIRDSSSLNVMSRLHVYFPLVSDYALTPKPALDLGVMS